MRWPRSFSHTGPDDPSRITHQRRTVVTVFQAFVLGVVQGLTEFLPVSSSGHLFLVRYLLGWPEPGLAFDVALHVGTLVAVLWYFRREWSALTRAALRVVRERKVRTFEERRVLFLIIATIPAALGGVVLADYAETVFRHPRITAIALIGLGLLLWIVDRVASRVRTLDTMRWSDALAIGGNDDGRSGAWLRPSERSGVQLPDEHADHCSGTAQGGATRRRRR